jgi:hypothetical protein
MSWCEQYGAQLLIPDNCTLGEWAYLLHLVAVVIIVGLAVGGMVGLLRSFFR